MNAPTQEDILRKAERDAKQATNRARAANDALAAARAKEARLWKEYTDAAQETTDARIEAKEARAYAADAQRAHETALKYAGGATRHGTRNPERIGQSQHKTHPTDLPRHHPASAYHNRPADEHGNPVDKPEDDDPYRTDPTHGQGRND